MTLVMAVYWLKEAIIKGRIGTGFWLVVEASDVMKPPLYTCIVDIQFVVCAIALAQDSPIYNNL